MPWSSAPTPPEVSLPILYPGCPQWCPHYTVGRLQIGLLGRKGRPAVTVLPWSEIIYLSVSRYLCFLIGSYSSVTLIMDAIKPTLIVRLASRDLTSNPGLKCVRDPTFTRTDSSTTGRRGRQHPTTASIPSITLENVLSLHGGFPYNANVRPIRTARPMKGSPVTNSCPLNHAVRLSPILEIKFMGLWRKIEPWIDASLKYNVLRLVLLNSVSVRLERGAIDLSGETRGLEYTNDDVFTM